MEFSTGFLNKLLDSAVEYYNNDNDVEILPDKINDITTGIQNFSSALIFEAHKSMQNEITNNETPILHAINLNSKNPGIISGQLNNKKYQVHKKSKPKKEKTQEQIEKDMIKAQERLEARKLKKEIKQKEKEDLKNEKEDIKNTKKEITQLTKEINKSQKIANNFQEKAQKANNEFQKKKNPTVKDKEYLQNLNNQANEYVNHYQNLLKTKENKDKDVNTRLKKINDDAELKKQQRLEKMEQRKK